MKVPRPGVDRDRQFGLVVGTVLLLAAAYFGWQDRTTAMRALATVGLVLVLLGYLQPRWLKYPSAAWWKLAMVLGYVNARIILTLIFSLVLVPLGVVWRLVGRDPLTRRRASWPGWSPYPPRYRDRTHYTRMF